MKNVEAATYFLAEELSQGTDAQDFDALAEKAKEKGYGLTRDELVVGFAKLQEELVASAETDGALDDDLLATLSGGIGLPGGSLSAALSTGIGGGAFGAVGLGSALGGATGGIAPGVTQAAGQQFLQLQQQMQQMSQLSQMMSNIMRGMHDSATSHINNLRG